MHVAFTGASKHVQFANCFVFFFFHFQSVLEIYSIVNTLYNY